ncbi:MAG TPA: PIN domain-containing protein [Candidatus Thermoplasmatota archaeon]|nr:PIN domain-containing protein [Candidatus Thermoplasmatota archaeon]
MYALDSSFVVDLVKGDEGARAKAVRMEEAGESGSIAAPALSEVMLGAYFAGGENLKRALKILETVTVMAVDTGVALEAARIGAELLRRGTPLALPDLLVAAAAKGAGLTVLTRDEGFGRITGLAVETY